MKNRKKIFIIIAVLSTFCFSICGCSKDKDKDISKKQLYASICNPNMQGVKEALKNHAELAKETIKTSSKTKPLELAVREIESEKIQLQICSQLIKSGADVNEKGIDGDTNLCWAIVNDRFDLANQLLDAGADPNQKGDEITALKGTVSRISFENYNEKMDMLNRLLESGAKPDSDIISFLLNDDNSNWGMQYYFTPQILKKLEKYDGKQNISQGLRAAMNGDDHKLQKLVISDKINKKDKGQVLAFAAAHCRRAKRRDGMLLRRGTGRTPANPAGAKPPVRCPAGGRVLQGLPRQLQRHDQLVRCQAEQPHEFSLPF